MSANVKPGGLISVRQPSSVADIFWPAARGARSTKPKFESGPVAKPMTMQSPGPSGGVGGGDGGAGGAGNEGVAAWSCSGRSVKRVGKGLSTVSEKLQILPARPLERFNPICESGRKRRVGWPFMIMRTHTGILVPTAHATRTLNQRKAERIVQCAEKSRVRLRALIHKQLVGHGVKRQYAVKVCMRQHSARGLFVRGSVNHMRLIQMVPPCSRFESSVR
eukprot:7128024-Prymnesium_polylepis.1